MKAFLLATTLFTAIVATQFVGAGPVQAQVFTIPCPTIPCPTFDGANFAKNSLTAMHNLQIMKDTILSKYYQYKNLLANTQGVAQISWSDISAQLNQIDALMHKDEQTCARLGYNNAYFVSKFPASTASESSPCNSANLSQAHSVLMDAKTAVENEARGRAGRRQQLDTDIYKLGKANGTVKAIQLSAAVTADLANEIQSQQQLEEAQINSQIRYYDTELARNAKADAEAKYSRTLSNYFKTGCYNDPEAKVKKPCSKRAPKTP